MQATTTFLDNDFLKKKKKKDDNICKSKQHMENFNC